MRKFRQAGLVISLFLLAVCVAIGVLYARPAAMTVFNIIPDLSEGDVVFRGAIVNGTWCNASDIVTQNKGWLFDTNVNTYSAVDQSPLTIELSQSDPTVFVFDIGPDCGSAVIQADTVSQSLNFKSEQQVENGLRFEIVGAYTQKLFLGRRINANVMSAICLVLAAIVMAFATSVLNEGRASKTDGNRNASVELFRYLIIISVCVHHYCALAPKGYLGVDFFFVLSGFLLMRSYERDSDDKRDVNPAVIAARYTKKRWFKLIAYYIVAYVLGLLVGMIQEGRLSGERFLTSGIWELSMLEGFGITTDLVVGPGWFCSALLIAGYFVYALLKWKRKMYLYCIAPVSLMLVFGLMYTKLGDANRWLQVDTFISTGVLRGFAELGLGVLCCVTSDRVHEKVLGRWRWLSSFFELLLICLIFAIIYGKIGGAGIDFAAIILMALLITSLFLGNSRLSDLLNNPISAYLGKISICIYLTHTILLKVNWLPVFGTDWNTTTFLLLVLITVYGAISTEFVQAILRYIRLNRKPGPATVLAAEGLKTTLTEKMHNAMTRPIKQSTNDILDNKTTPSETTPIDWHGRGETFYKSGARDNWKSLLKKYKPLLRELIIRDLKVKYRRSFLGYLWSLLNPLLMMVVMNLVFTRVLRNDIVNFPLYLICGQTLFGFFSESTGMAMTSIMSNSSLIKKIYIPKYIFPLSRTLSSFVTMSFSLVAILLVMVFTGAKFYWTMLLTILPILGLLMFCCGMGMILSSLAVYFRDITHLWSVVTMAWMYGTPIFYSVDNLDGIIGKIIRLNPMYHFINVFRHLVMYGNIPGINAWIGCAFSAIVPFFFGLFLFNKLKKKFILHI